MRTLRTTLCLELGLIGVMAGCGEHSISVDDGKRCVSGELAPCECPGGATGRRTCQTSGGGFGSCDCSPRGRSSSPVTKAGTGGSDESRSGDGGSTASGTAGRSAPAPGGAGGAGGATGSQEPEGGSGGIPADGSNAPEAGSAGEPLEPREQPTMEEPKPELLSEPMDEAAYLFDDTKLRTYDIQITAADLASIDAKPSDERWVPARLQFEGMSYGPFMVRYKGSAGSFKAPCTTGGRDDPKQGKCSIKIGFDEVDPELRFFGLKKLNFHAMSQDRSLLRDRLSYSLFRDHQVAASRAVHARVLINGRLEGLFVAVEQVDGRFTRARFGDGGEGNVYKEAWVTVDTSQNYLDALETNTNEMPSVQRMLDFQKAVLTSTEETARFVDKAYLLRYFAVDRVTMNDDGVLHFYCDPAVPNFLGTSHNFYWYEGQEGQRMWLIPWDLDLTFDVTPWVRVTPHWMATAPCTCVKDTMYDAQTPPSCDPLVKHVIAWRTDYEQEVDRFLAGPFSQAKVDAKLSTWMAQIRPAVIEAAGVNLSPNESAWNDGIADLRAKIASARQNRGFAY